MARSLNSVQIIGNLTRDPELRYTPTGTAVVTIGIATNRSWTTDSGEKKEEVEYHRVVAWNKLAELCSQLLAKGTKVYVHGRLATRSWTGQDGSQKSTTEIVIDDMIVLSGIKPRESGEEFVGANDTNAAPTEARESQTAPEKTEEVKSKPAKKEEPSSVAKAMDDKKEKENDEEVSPDDIPF